MEFKVQQIVLDDPEQHNGDSQNAALSVKKQALIAICDGCEELSSSLSGAEPTSPPSSFQNEGFGTHYATSLQLSDQEDELTVAVLLSKQAEDMPDEGDPTTRSTRVRSTGRPCKPQPSFVPNHDAGEIFPSAALASPAVALPTWHFPSPIATSSPSAAAIVVPSSFPCPSSLAPKLWISPLKPRFSRVVMMDTLYKEAGAEVQENEPYVSKELHRQVTHSMPPKKVEIFKSLEESAETEVLTYLKPVEKSWQTQDFLPEPSFDGFVDEVRELRARCTELPNDYLVCLVDDIITEEALPTYQTILNTLDGHHRPDLPLCMCSMPHFLPGRSAATFPEACAVLKRQHVGALLRPPNSPSL